MEEAFRALLTGSAAVTALVPAGRINWGEHLRGADGPYIVLTMISDIEGLTMQGPDGLADGRVQVDCYANTPAITLALGRAVLGGGQVRLGVEMPIRSPIPDGGLIDMEGVGLFEAVNPRAANPGYGIHRVARTDIALQEWLR